MVGSSCRQNIHIIVKWAIKVETLSCHYLSVHNPIVADKGNNVASDRKVYGNSDITALHVPA